VNVAYICYYFQVAKFWRNDWWYALTFYYIFLSKLCDYPFCQKNTLRIKCLYIQVCMCIYVFL